MKQGAIVAEVEPAEPEYTPEVGGLHLPGPGAALEDLAGAAFDVRCPGEGDQACWDRGVVETCQCRRRGLDHPHASVDPEPQHPDLLEGPPPPIRGCGLGARLP